MKLDLKALNPKQRANDGAWVEIRLDGEPIGLEIKVRGRFSDVYEKISRDAQRRAAAEFKRTKEFQMPDPEDTEQKRLEIATACTVDWRGDANQGEFSAAAARELYQAQPWILEQVDRAITEDARFLK